MPTATNCSPRPDQILGKIFYILLNSSILPEEKEGKKEGKKGKVRPPHHSSLNQEHCRRTFASPIFLTPRSKIKGVGRGGKKGERGKDSQKHSCDAVSSLITL